MERFFRVMNVYLPKDPLSEAALRPTAHESASTTHYCGL